MDETMLVGADAMRIEEAIVDWAKGRPSWQRAVLRRAAQGEQLGNADFAAITDRLLKDGWATDEQLALDDMPRAAGSAKPVVLLALRNLEHVNALVGDQPLEFSPTGLTVVYGDNGSGKSGYARLIKLLVRARHRQDVLSDVFQDPPSAKQSANVVVDVGGTSRPVAWPDETCPELAQITFYDEACGDAFITKESDVTYKPAALAVLDELIRACDGVRTEIDRRLRQNDQERQTLPALPQGTTAAKLLSGLATATEDAIERACSVPEDVDAQIDELRREEARLHAADPAQEKQRLKKDAEALRTLSSHLASCKTSFGADAVKALAMLREDKATKEQAAALASSQSLDGEPLEGVGMSAWRAMWDAARKYSTDHAYPTQPFPNTGSEARCVLCQQLLPDDASARLNRFEAFVRDETQRRLLQATTKWDAEVRKVSEFQVTPANVSAALDRLGKEHGKLVAECRSALDAHAGRRASITEACTGGSPWPAEAEPTVPAGLLEKADDLDAQADEMDDAEFAAKLGKATNSRAELEAKKLLGANREVVIKEMARLQERGRLEALKKQTATTGISTKATELTREHTTAIMRDRFTRESDRLRLERVTLQDRGGTKGALLHRPALVNAVQDAQVRQVLSEGEQTALGLAGFFTDVHLDASKSAIVLDDPVSSLDHGRRSYVAARLAQLGLERQVIVFTHDIAFVVALRKAAEAENAGFTERSITRVGNSPGGCKTEYPWKAKDVSARIDMLERELARIRREAGGWDSEEYERACALWGGALSETWECVITQEVVAQAFDINLLEARPQKFRILARVTEDDDRELQASYSRASTWAKRHNKDPNVNYVAPKADDLAEEVGRLKAWFKRVKAYRN